jgi:hypothetical protein
MSGESHATPTRRELAWVALVLTLLAVLALRPSIHGMDGVGNYVYLASLLRGGDLDFRDDYALFDARRDYPFRFADLPVNPRTGRPSNRYGVGSALFWSPFVIPLHVALLAVRPDLADPISRPYEWAVGVGTAFWGSLGLWLLYRKLREEWGRLTCGAATAALVLATPLGFYLYAHGSMSHGIGFFLTTALLLAFDRAWRRPDARALAGCGALAGLLVITRFQDAPWALLTAGALAWRVSRRDDPTASATPRQPAMLSVFVLTALLVALPQLAVWKSLYGSWLSGPLPYLDASAGRFELWPRHGVAALFSGRHGALAWHPAIAVGLGGLVALARRRPRWRAPALLGLAGFAALAWLVGCWSMWWAGASFGNRFFISALPFVALGLAPVLEAGGRRRRQASALAALGLLMVWNLGLLFQYATQMIPREDPVSWPRVIRQNLVDVPRRLVDRLF